MLSLTQFSVAVGIAVGAVAAFGGFGAFVLVVFFGAIGFGVARVLEGRLDLGSLVGSASRSGDRPPR